MLVFNKYFYKKKKKSIMTLSKTSDLCLLSVAVLALQFSYVLSIGAMRRCRDGNAARELCATVLLR
jgi:hypothetical protein